MRKASRQNRASLWILLHNIAVLLAKKSNWEMALVAEYEAYSLLTETKLTNPRIPAIKDGLEKILKQGNLILN